jgi:glutamate carboxypeptidase
VIAIEEMTDYERGVTTNVGFMRGGTVPNVVAAEAEAEVDLRVPTQELAREMLDRIVGLKPHDPDVKVEIAGELNRPPYVKDERVAKLFDHASALAKDIGFDLVESPMTGGGSDGNFTAALGIPTLDGLGVDGDGAHTFHEQLYFSSLAPRASLMIRLFETLE